MMHERNHRSRTYDRIHMIHRQTTCNVHKNIAFVQENIYFKFKWEIAYEIMKPG